MRSYRLICRVLLLAHWCASACTSDSTAAAQRSFQTPFSAVEAPPLQDSPLAPLPTTLDLDARKVALGERLYFDRRLSGDGAVHCGDCHDAARGGSNGTAGTRLPNRPSVEVNVPSVFNAAFNFRFAWSGRFNDVGQQIDAAMKSSAAMAGGWSQALDTLRKDAQLVQEFERVYPEGMTETSLREAVAIYTLSLFTPNARFDRYLRGELSLSASEARGWDRFREYGCVSCHQGLNIGGNMSQKLGVVRDYFIDRGEIRAADYGLYGATTREQDRFVFRVPSLRNVAVSAPYLHDGSIATLEEVIVVMARYQLGRELSTSDITDLAAFLRSLTGELKGKPL